MVSLISLYDQHTDIELCPYLISEVRAAKQTMAGTARVSVTA